MNRMNGDLDKAFTYENLNRAWKWINTNPSYEYKNYFRDSYLSYNFNLSENLKGLASRLKTKNFTFKTPGVLYKPKTAYITRKITLLPIEDQILYQSLINIIAEKTKNRYKKNYYKTAFGNLYSAKNQHFFYRRWQEGYKSLNRNIKESYNSGYEYKGSFDLASCYDSIDHKVLGYLLDLIDLDREFIDFLLMSLSHWTTNKQIYMGHGIPQGPLSSGLLSEVILTTIDDKFNLYKLKDIKYFRYVDDITLMGKSREEIVYALAVLDYISKTIGLFPQTSKIEVHKICNINEEINTISDIFDISDSGIKIRDSINLEDAFKKTYKDNIVIEKTKFKLILPKLESKASIANIALGLLKYNPEYIETVCLYLSAYKRDIPSSCIKQIIDIINSVDVYQINKALLIDSVFQKLKDTDRDEIIVLINKMDGSPYINHPFLRYVILKFKLINNQIKYSELIDELKSMKSWWVKKSILKYIEIDRFGEPSYYDILNHYLCECEEIECILEASKMVIDKGLEVKKPYANINYIGQQTLRTHGIINRVSSKASYIPDWIYHIAKIRTHSFNWAKKLKVHHDVIERKLSSAKNYMDIDTTAFVNVLDTLNDLFLEELSHHDESIGEYNRGNIGGYCGGVTSNFAKKYPMFNKYCNEIHKRRLESVLSHAYTKSTGKPTTYIKYSFKFEATRLFKEAIKELILLW